MLVVKLKRGEQVLVGEAVVTVLEPGRGGQVKLGVEAPRAVPVRRLVPGGQPKPDEDREFTDGIL